MIYPIELNKLYSVFKAEYVKAFEKFIDDGIFINGKYVELFEDKVAEFLGAKYVVGCGNGTHALQLALLAENIGEGDEVITVANTYYATVCAIYSVGAKPVFCDVDENAQMNSDKIESLITERTKAVLPVHLYGMNSDLDRIVNICKKHNLLLIEDCAHAFGTKENGKYLGSDSKYACFSLYPTKNLGAFGDAGMIATNSEKAYKKMLKLRYYASNEQRDTFEAKSIHSRLDPVQACMLCVSLEHISDWNAIRRAHCDYYINRFKGVVRYFKEMEKCDVIPYVFPVITSDQSGLLQHLRDKGIYGHSHYNVDLHKIEHFKPSQTVDLPMTEYLNKSVVSIPVSQTVTNEQLCYIADVVCEYFRENE